MDAERKALVFYVAAEHFIVKQEEHFERLRKSDFYINSIGKKYHSEAELNKWESILLEFLGGNSQLERISKICNIIAKVISRDG